MQIQFGGGTLFVNLADQTYNNVGIFTSVGGTDKENGGVMRIGQPRVKQVFTENDHDEPSAEWTEGRDIYFDVTLAEMTLNNFALALGLNPNIIGSDDSATYLTVVGSEPIVYFPAIYQVPQFELTNKFYWLTLPKCEILNAVEVGFKDDEPVQLKLSLKAHKATSGTLAGMKFQIKKDK
jgi:hypothetical protein